MKDRRRPRSFSLSTGHYLFAGVFLLRLIALAQLSASRFLLPTRGDMHFYNEWALRILHGQWTDHQAFYGLPLYPYLLAGTYKVFGYGPFLPALIQAVCEGGTAVLLYRLAVRLFGSADASLAADPACAAASGARGRIIGVMAALGWALFQPAAAYSIVLMPTSALVFVLWWLVWLVVKKEEAPTTLHAFLFGLLIGFSAMGIATVLFFIPLLLAALFLKPAKSTRQPRWAINLVGAIALLLGVGAGSSPAWLHNRFIAHDPVFLSAHSGVNLWIGNNPWATGYPRFPPGLHAGQEAMLQDSITGAEAAAGHRLKRSEVSRFWSGQTSAYISKHFGQWLKLLGRKVANFWSAFQYDDLSIIVTLREDGVIFPGLSFGLVAALAIPGIIFACWRFPRSRWILAVILLQMLSLLSVFVTERYRLAAVPGLILFGAYGIWELWQACWLQSYRQIAILLALLALGTWCVSIPKGDASLWALDSYNTGLQALESNNLATAARKLELAHAYVPGNAEVNFALGNLNLARGNRKAAKSYYYATLRLDPRHEGSYNNLGVLSLEDKNWPLAAECFRRALGQNPRDPKTHFLLAKVKLEQGDRIAAHREIARALELDPKPSEFSALRSAIDRAGP